MYPTEIHSKKILFAVLNWGLGHATRSSVLINQLIKQGNRVDVISCGNALAYLKKEFPEATFFNTPHLSITYGKVIPLFVKLILQAPKMYVHAKRVQGTVSKLQKEKQYDIIISDNYFGCHNKGAFNIFITHQIKPAVPPWFQQLRCIPYWFNKKLIEKFNICWIPDDEQLHLSKAFTGSLSIPVYYIGLLSRFEIKASVNKFDIAIILSGPEPTRSVIEKKLLLKFGETDKKIVLIRGVPNSSLIHVPDNTTVFNSANTNELQQIISQSKEIIARSGYSSIMDYYHLDIPATLIPTKRQTEQEELCRHPLIKRRFSILYEKERNRF